MNKHISVFSGKTAKIIVLSAFIMVLFIGASPPVSSAQTLEELQKQIVELQQKIRQLELKLLSQAVPQNFRFTRNLSFGSRGTDVLYLQRFLNTDPETELARTGPGSKGNETTYFGPLTRSAVQKFQELYGDEVLAPLRLTRGTGFAGTMTLAKLNSLVSAVGGPDPEPEEPPEDGTPPPQTPIGAVLTVFSGTQPQNTLAPRGASRLPFTRITLTAGTNSPVTVRSFIIERTGLAQDSAFSGVLALDEQGNQIGIERRFDSNHRTTVGDNTVIPAGTSRTFTIAGNTAANLAAFTGQTVSLSVIGINTAENALISDAFKITGATHTLNNSLEIGTATLRVGSLGTFSATKEVGTVNYTFSSIIITAGGNEDIRLKSIKWQQTGSASKDDLAGAVALIDGISYPLSVSPDGKFFTANFGEGIIMRRGLSKETSVRADIASGAGRTVEFDIDRASDIFITGENFGFGITPAAPSTSAASLSTAEFTTGTPFFSGAQTTISGGTITLSRATAIPSQNIGIQVPNQPLGGFEIAAQGEPIDIQTMNFDVAVTQSAGSSATVNDIDNVSLTNQDGVVLAGPSDAVGSGATGTLTLSGTITIPQGKHIIILKGQLSGNFRDGDRITFSLEPSSDLTGARGTVSGNNLTASPGSTVSGNIMTVRGARMTLTVSPVPIAQSVVSGVQDFTFANFVLDASNSGESMRINSLPVKFTASAGPENITACRLFDENTLLTSGSNIVNPGAGFASGNNLTFAFDAGLTAPKETVKTIALKCNISGSAGLGATYRFGLSSAAPTVTGIDSARTITADIVPNDGQIMTISSSGSFTVIRGSGSPAYAISVAGSTVTNGILRFAAGSEPIQITQVALQLTGAPGQSSAVDLADIGLFDGARRLGGALFTGANTTTTAFLTDDFIVPQGGTKDMTVRITLSEIGLNKPGKEGALIKIDYDGNNAANTKAIGLSSGASINSGSTADTTVSGTRMFKTVPTFVKDNVPTTTLINGTRPLLRFHITANSAGDIGVDKFTAKLETVSATVSGVNIFAFTDEGFSSPAPEFANGGQLNSANQNPDVNGEVEIFAEDLSGNPNPLQVPAGQTRWFEARGTITGVSTINAVVITTLLGDSAYTALATPMGTASQAQADANNNFIWSPNANTTSLVTDIDWTNGFGIPGLPSQGFSETLSR